MEHGRFAQTRRGQISRMRQRRLRRFMLKIEQEPKSKNISLAEAIIFQKAIADRLDKSGASAFTGPVFLQLEFSTTSKTPPAIYNLPKNYLDQLEIPRDGSGIDRKHLLYKNDRKVKALIVKYRLGGADDKPSIWVKAEPKRDFLADVQLLGLIREDDFEDDDDRWPGFGSDDLERGPFEREERWDDDGFEKLMEFERDKASFVRRFGNETYDAWREMMRLKSQQEDLRRTDRFICRSVLSAFQDAPRTKDGAQDIYLAQLAATTRNMSLGAPFVLDLHHSPHQSGDRDAFDKVLRKALADYKDKSPHLFPLSSQLCVTILMVPPESDGKDLNSGKDLDNLARLILPALHEIWAPPSHAAHRIDPTKIKDESIRAYWEKVQKSLPKEPKNSITEYRAFELPPLPGDSKDGFVRLAVGEGQMPVRFREEIDDYLGKWRDIVD
jgi:AcrR family transcriptional regulator